MDANFNEDSTMTDDEILKFLLIIAITIIFPLWYKFFVSRNWLITKAGLIYKSAASKWAWRFWAFLSAYLASLSTVVAILSIILVLEK
jgi:hypothetical protein